MWPFSQRSEREQSEQDSTHHSSDSSILQDPTLEQKKRARRRLLGAVVIASVAIIILPLLFDSEPRPVGEDIAIKIPDRETSFQSPKTQAQQTNENQAKMASEVISETKNNVISESQTAPKGQVRKENSNEVQSGPKSQSKTNSSAPSLSNKKMSSNSIPNSVKEKVTIKTEKNNDAKRAQAALEGKELPIHSESKFIVQLGAFSGMERVKELQQKLTAAGIKSYTQKIQTKEGERIRLRIGPYLHRQEAEQVREKVKGLGLPATILTLK